MQSSHTKSIPACQDWLSAYKSLFLQSGSVGADRWQPAGEPVVLGPSRVVDTDPPGPASMAPEQVASALADPPNGAVHAAGSEPRADVDSKGSRLAPSVLSHPVLMALKASSGQAQPLPSLRLNIHHRSPAFAACLFITKLSVPVPRFSIHVRQHSMISTICQKAAKGGLRAAPHVVSVMAVVTLLMSSALLRQCSVQSDRLRSPSSSMLP